MTWFKVDDGFWSHPKTLALSPNAVALWTRAGSYCGKHLTDGFVSAAILPMLQGTEADADELVDAGLWCQVEGGWTFWEWTVYQDSRETVERRRAAWKERQKRRRESVNENDETTPSSSNHSIPFLSKGTRDSRRDTPRDTPTPPPYAEVMRQLEATVAHTESAPA